MALQGSIPQRRFAPLTSAKPTATAARLTVGVAAEVEQIVRAAFPRAEISTKVDVKRQGILDSWPADVDDTAARRDWGHAPAYDLTTAFGDYLIPTIRKRYS